MNKFLKNSNFAMTVIIVIGILAVLNFFSYNIFYRFDLTGNKDYSISKVSKNTVSKLGDILNIKVYFSKNLPSQYVNLPQEVGDILDEYANYSGGKIKVEFIDPKDDTELKQKLMIMGIPELQFNVLEKDKYQVVNGYLGIAVQYGDRTEVIPVVQDTNNLEYEITLAIKKVVNKEKTAIGYLTSNGTLSAEKEIPLAYKNLSEIYNVEQVNLTEQKEISAEIKTLIIAGPKENFNEEELKTIDQFLMKGGSLFVLLDGVKVGDGLKAEKNITGMEGLLEKYGVKLNNNLVLDVSSGMASFNQGFITFSTPYPFWPKVIKTGFNKDNVSTAKLESVLFPWASSIDLETDKIDKDNKISYLAKSSIKSWTLDGEFNLNPQQDFNPTNQGEKNLAVSIFGKFQSAYGNGSTDKGRIVAVGDSDFVSDGFVRQSPDNMIMFQNLVDSLSLDEDLINIRSKGITDRPLKEIEESKKASMKYGNIFGVMVAVVLFGIFRYYRRKKVDFIDEL